jgi:flagellar protein FlgJ
MRDASASLSDGDSLMDNDQSDMYREMFDNQMAMQLAKGRGLGLADMLVRQLTESGGKVALPSMPAQTPAAPTSFSMPSRPTAEVSAPRDVVAPKPVVVEKISNDSPGAKNTVASPKTETSAAQSAKPLAAPSRAVTPLAATREEFIAQLMPHAEAAAKELGVDAKTLVAHAALETGWGKFVPCNPDGSCSFNLFGIKATGRHSDAWRGAATAVNTLEYEDGVAVKRRESFRAYESPADSFRDYAALLKNSRRYASALGAGDNARAFASALQNGGYATDPSYADKLASVASALKKFISAPLASGSGVARGGSRT